MAFPRAIALSEVLWSAPEMKSFDGFSQRLYREFSRLDRDGVGYRIPKPIGLVDRAFSETGEPVVELSSPIPDASVYFTVDGTAPDVSSSQYREPIVLNLASGKLVHLKAFVLSSTGRRSKIYGAKFTRLSKPELK